MLTAVPAYTRYVRGALTILLAQPVRLALFFSPTLPRSNTSVTATMSTARLGLSPAHTALFTTSGVALALACGDIYGWDRRAGGPSVQVNAQCNGQYIWRNMRLASYAFFWRGTLALAANLGTESGHHINMAKAKYPALKIMV